MSALHPPVQQLEDQLLLEHQHLSPSAAFDALLLQAFAAAALWAEARQPLQGGRLAGEPAGVWPGVDEGLHVAEEQADRSPQMDWVHPAHVAEKVWLSFVFSITQL